MFINSFSHLISISIISSSNNNNNNNNNNNVGIIRRMQFSVCDMVTIVIVAPLHHCLDCYKYIIDDWYLNGKFWMHLLILLLLLLLLLLLTRDARKSIRC